MRILPLSACVLLAASAMWSCSNSDKKDDKAAEAKDVVSVHIPTDAEGNPISGVRYYDIDTVRAKYNLAKDYLEASMRLQRNLESTYNTRSASVQKAAESFQTKLNGGQFTSETEAKTAYENVQKMQTNAANELENLKRNADTQMINMEQEILDSISSVVNDIGRANGLEVILVKSPAQYFAPALDITDAVIEELNKRYTKVADK